MLLNEKQLSRPRSESEKGVAHGHILDAAPAAVAPKEAKEINAKKSTDDSSIWQIRTEEQSYAFLNDKVMLDANRYGKKIDLIALTENKLPVGRSMFINENPAVGSNPNRNKQHGFFFTADNCIGCHACEAACSEKKPRISPAGYVAV